MATHASEGESQSQDHADKMYPDKTGCYPTSDLLIRLINPAPS
jgi:hypothetical protein